MFRYARDEDETKRVALADTLARNVEAGTGEVFTVVLRGPQGACSARITLHHFDITFASL